MNTPIRYLALGVIFSFALQLLPVFGADHAHRPGCPCGQADPEALEKVDLGTVKIRVPEVDQLPKSFRINFRSGKQRIEVEFEKSYIFGKNTRFLVEQKNGTMKEISCGKDCSYLGHRVDAPNLMASAVITPTGLLASIECADGRTLVLEPKSRTRRTNRHLLSVEVPGGDVQPSPAKVRKDLGARINKRMDRQLLEQPLAEESPTFVGQAQGGSNGGPTARPRRQLTVREYEIGVEIGTRTLEGAHRGDVDFAMANVARIPGNMDRRYLSGCGIKHVLGTVMIRTSGNDPLAGRVTSNSTGSLNAFRDYWNRNPNEVGRSHDIAVTHAFSPPSGRAYRNAVGTSNRYAVSCGRSATSWADGTLIHEFGHSWNLRHVSDSPIRRYDFDANTFPTGRFYESRPRDDQGRSSSGGSHRFISVMDGRGTHNIRRLATEEANTVISAMNNKLRFGTVVSNPGAIRPFGARDLFTAAGSPVVMDVVDNDWDANNDPLDCRLLDTVSFRGARISLSAGTGPGGRNRIIYTPSANLNGTDFFHYTVVDPSGRSDFGCVYVNNSGPTTVDLTATSYDYDLGLPGGVTQGRFTAISNQTRGDISWSGPRVEARDRGVNPGVNNINRDLVQSTSPATFNHRISNGVYDVLINMGDVSAVHDRMKVSAENGQVVRENINSARGVFTAVGFRVRVTDNVLNLTFSDEGGSDANWVVTRISINQIETLPDGPSLQLAFVSPSPAEGARLAVGANLSLKVNPSEAVSNVRLERNGTLVRVEGGAPYEWGAAGQNDPLLRNLADGTYTFRAIAQGSDGRTVNQDLVVIVGSGNGGGSGGGNGGGGSGGGSTTNSTGAFDNQTSYRWDFGPEGAPLQSGFRRFTNNTTQGFMRWTRRPSRFGAVIHTGGQLTDNYRRSLIYSFGQCDIAHQVRNGRWEVKVDFTDKFVQNNMIIRAEGRTRASNIDVPAQTVGQRVFNVDVTDGTLNLEFDDADSNKIVTIAGILLRRIGDIPNVRNAWRFDFGTPSSPVQAGWIRITTDTRSGPWRWLEGGGTVRDRGANLPDNDNVRRDLIFHNQNKRFRVDTGNGRFRVRIMFGDLRFRHDDFTATAEGVEFGRVTTEPANGTGRVEITRETTVEDGNLTIDFRDLGGTDVNWSIMGVLIDRL